MRMEFLTTRRWSRSVVILLLAVILTACGADDGEDEPTATSDAEGAQPTVAVALDSTPGSTPVGEAVEGSPTNTDLSDLPAGEIAEAGVATPAIAVGVTPDTASPEAEAANGIAEASPETGADATPVSSGIPATSGSSVTGNMSETVMEGDPVVGDGTTGASVETPGDATPAVSMVRPAATPTTATPSAQTTVSGCDVANVPPYTGEQATYAITTGVMFRAGPGADCDLALETPLGEFQQVVIIGGPVTREDDGSEWVQLTVNGTEGWVSFEFLEPVS